MFTLMENPCCTNETGLNSLAMSPTLINSTVSCFSARSGVQTTVFSQCTYIKSTLCLHTGVPAFGMTSLYLAALSLPMSVLRLSTPSYLLRIQMYIWVCGRGLVREPKAYFICNF